MFGVSARFVLFGMFTLSAVACGEDTAPPRGTAQPGDMCSVDNDCAVGFVCNDATCQQTDPYRISLTWEVDTDFDLHVVTPNGRELYFDRDNEQAWLGGDDCGADNCIDVDGIHAEHAFLRAIDPPLVDVDAGDTDAGDNVTRMPAPLRYEYWADNYGCKRAGDFTLTVVALDGTVRATQTGTLEARCVESAHFTFTIE